jgi:DNA-binding transcriptional MerR regulator
MTRSSQSTLPKQLTPAKDASLTLAMVGGSSPIADNDAPELLTIGTLSKTSSLTVRTLRYYEEIDLIAPAGRTEGRYRLYHPHVLKRLTAIQSLQELNYTLEEILAILGPASVAADIHTRTVRVEASKQALRQQKRAVEEKLEIFQQLRADLAHRIEVLDTICSACIEQAPADMDCNSSCNQRDVHLD